MLLFASSCGFIIIPKDNRVFCCCFVFLFVFSLEGLGFCLFGVLVFKVSDAVCLFPLTFLGGKSSYLCVNALRLWAAFAYCDPYLVENQGQCQC